MIYLATMDPPWSSDNGGGGRGAQNHYGLSGPAAIAAAVQQSGMWQQQGDALVWVWVTTRALVTMQAFALMTFLDVVPVSSFVWNKCDDRIPSMMQRQRGGPRRDRQRPLRRKMGLGQWQRTEHEHLFVCRRGSIGVPPPSHRHRSTIYAPRGRHSAKPEEAWRVIESTSAGIVGDLGFLSSVHGYCGTEFFARTARPGWRAFGNQLATTNEAA